MTAPDTGHRLGLSASRGGLRAAVCRADGAVHTLRGDAPASAMVGEIAALLREAGIEAAELDHVVCDVGPGSYTGLRVAVTFARFVAAFGRAALWQVESPVLLAAQAFDHGVPGPLHVLLDARRDRVHHAIVAVDDTGRVHASQPPRCRLRDELRLEDHPAADALVDAALVEWFPQSHAADRPITAHALVDIEPEHLVRPERVAVTAISAFEIEPLYLMGSYAET